MFVCMCMWGSNTRMCILAINQARCVCVCVHSCPPGLPSGPHILLTTYKLVQALPQQTLARYHVVVVDESHKLKNPTTDQ